jgi:predicted glycoside hydrolase/deacetylase ChbG (UPF0249 family)
MDTPEMKQGDRRLILHADDVGMCHEAVDAFLQLSDFGLVSCGSAMVPCPAFAGIAAHARQNPEMDLGLHITMTSEYDTYRWSPLSTADPASGLIDGDGFFHKRPADFFASAQEDAVRAEYEAQVQRAIDLGVQPTHIDSHHGILSFDPRFIPLYVEIAQMYGIPPFLKRGNPFSGMQPPTKAEKQSESEEKNKSGMPAFLAAIMAAIPQITSLVAQYEQAGLPMIDHSGGLMPDTAENRMERTKGALRALQPGITVFVIHPLVDSPLVRAITPTWGARVADFEIFMSTEMQDFVAEQGIEIVGYKDIGPQAP